MQRQLLGGLGIQLLQEGQPFLVSVLGGRLTEDFPVQIGQGRKERHRAVPGIIMRARAHMAHAQRQPSGFAPEPDIGSFHRSTKPGLDPAD